MSDNILSVIPTDPDWQPEPTRAELARTVVEELLPRERLGFDEVKVTWHEQVTPVDCGENLERITCPNCKADIDTEWWFNLMERWFAGGVHELIVPFPCCGRTGSLIELEYDWPCGFARFEIEIWNPDRDWLTEDELASIADAVGHPVRQIMAHI